MTQSMTGFARGSVSTPSFAVIVEIRSVNNRYLDLHFRCPEALRSQETAWRKAVTDAINRGKVEVSIKVNQEHSQASLSVNPEQLSAVAGALSEVRREFPNASDPNALELLMAPGVMTSEEIDDKALAEAVGTALDAALVDLVQQRLGEGEKLAEMVRQRLQSMSALLVALREHLPKLRALQRQRILDRIAALDTEEGVAADPKRIEEELVYLAHRSDVDEEMDRLGAHIEAIEEALRGDAPCGRRLDFLMQELNREANTLSSKSTALTTTNTAVEFKVLIEQMREQIQNIE